MNETDLKRKKFAGIAKVAIGAVVIAAIAPALILLAKGIASIAVIGGIGLLIINAAPVVSMKLANWKVKEIVKEAKTNPIETMVNVANDRADRLKGALQRIGDLSASVKNFSDKVVGFKKQWPNDAAMFDQAVTNAQKVLAKWTSDYKIAKQALEAYLLEIEKCRAVNDMAVEMAALNKMAQMDSDKLMEELKSKTAIDEVSRRMNSAVAQLETSLLEEVNFSVTPGTSAQNASLLTNDPAQIVDFSTVTVAQKV
jgi:vacuolar-type H+-ATPase subunit I/STV1